MKLVVLALSLSLLLSPTSRAENSLWTQAFPEAAPAARISGNQKMGMALEELGAIAAYWGISLEDEALALRQSKNELSAALYQTAQQQLIDKDPVIANFLIEEKRLAEAQREAETAIRDARAAAKAGDAQAEASLADLTAGAVAARRARLANEGRWEGYIESVDLRTDSLVRSLEAGASEDSGLTAAFESTVVAKKRFVRLQTAKLLLVALLAADGGSRLAALWHQRDPGYVPSVALGWASLQWAARKAKLETEKHFSGPAADAR